MKKFLICLLLIIPILVVFSLDATGAIISLAVSVEATSINIKDSNNIEFDYYKTIPLELTDEPLIVIINVFPTNTYSKNVNFKHTKDSIGRVETTKIADNKYQIKPVEGGPLQLVVSATNNVNARKSLNFYIEQKRMGSFAITSKLDITNGVISPLTPTKLSTNIFPQESVGNNIITWSSAKESIVKIDKNGILYPISSGKSKITAEVNDRLGNTHISSLIVDTTSSLVNTTFGYLIEKPTVELVTKNFVVKPDAIVREVAYNDFSVESDGDRCRLQVMQTFEDSWDFVDNFIDDNIIYLKNGGYNIDADYLVKRSESLPVELSISDQSLATLNGTVLTPIHEGNIDIVAHLGTQIKVISFQIKERARNFILNQNETNDAVGIEQKRVWGYNFSYNESITSSYQLEVASVYPENSTLNLAFTSDNLQYASVDSYGRVTFSPHSIGKKVTITATALIHNIPTLLSRSYTFDILPDANATNVFSSKSATFIAHWYGYPIALQSDIAIDSTLRLYNHLYGNGYTVDASALKNYIYVPCLDVENTTEIINIKNVTLVGAPENNIDTTRGVGIMLYEKVNRAKISFVIIRNFREGISINDSAYSKIEGSILGDCGFTAISLSYDFDNNSRLEFNNNIFKPTPHASIAISSSTFDTSKKTVNYIPTMVFSGFNKIYNWKKVSELSHILDNVDFSAIEEYIDLTTVKKVISGLLEQSFKLPKYSHFVYTSPEKVQYVSFGLFALGTMNYVDPTRFIVNDRKLEIANVPMPTSSDGGSISILLSLAEAALSVNNAGITLRNPCYILSYQFTENMPPILPGETCPQTDELLKELRDLI